jgi:hypothetical protein
MVLQDKRWLEQNLNPTNQALWLNQCHCVINPQDIAITQKSNLRMITNQASNTPLANTPI